MDSEINWNNHSSKSTHRPPLSRRTTGPPLLEHTYDHGASSTSLSKLIARGIEPPSLRLASEDKLATPDKIIFSDDDGVESEERSAEGSTKRIFRTQSWVERTLAGIKYDSIGEDSSDDESIILQIGMTSALDKPSMDIRQDDPWFSERTFLGDHGAEGDDMHVSEIVVKNKYTDIFIRSLGWNSDKAYISASEKIKKRDADSTSELLWSLASFI